MSDVEYGSARASSHVSAPFIALGGLAGLAAFAWLAIVGEWMAIATGIAGAFGMPLLFRFATLPGTGLLRAFAFLTDRNFRILALPVGFLASLYSNVLVMIWCFGVFSYYAGVYCQDLCAPFLLWGYFVAMTPLAFLARFDADDRRTALFLFIFHIQYAVLAVSFVVGKPVEEALLIAVPLALVMPCIALLGAITTLSRKAG